MLRRDWLLALLVIGSSVIEVGRVRADTPLDASSMRAALRTATDEENGFLESVVKMMHSGDLPTDLVESTFLWARKKPKHKFQYFKRALILRAAELNIQLQ